MLILGLDTSSSTAACALWRDEVLLGEAFCNVGLTHSQTSLPMVEFLLRQTGVPLSEVKLFGVTAGPGSFTGLRIGISQVKGMAQPENVPCAPVSTLEALAWNLPQQKGLLVPCLDARRQQVYTALFRWEKDTPVRLTEDGALSLESLWEKIGSYRGPVTFLGDGGHLALAYAMSHRDEKSACDVKLAPPALCYLRGSSVAQCANQMYLANKTVTPDALEPFYLRPPEVYQK